MARKISKNKEQVKPVNAQAVTNKAVKAAAKEKEYHLKMKLNDQIFECDTDNLGESILSFAPKVLKTKIVFTITRKDGKVVDRQEFAKRGRMIFRKKLFLDIFLKNLVFKSVEQGD